jgi:ABC-type antimicrobial peptide transport system permease subunit
MDSVKLNAAASFEKEIQNMPGVINASSYYHNLTGDHGSISGFQWAGKTPKTDIDFSNLEVGYNFLETAGIRIKEGRNFSTNANAQNEIIFNETAIKAMGLKDPIGKTVKFWDQQRKIVGIAADFNFESLYQTVKPCFFQVYPIMPNILVRVKRGTEKQTIDRIEKTYAGFNYGQAFEYKFLDEDYQALYNSEKRVGILSRCFAGLAILISCLGLFGLAAFTAQRRQKEMGIRKVVGASVQEVAFLLSREFLYLVGIAMLIAFPIVWWAMNTWLNGFSYRIHIGPDVFLITAASVIAITYLTIGYQAFKSALANPIKALRSE